MFVGDIIRMRSWKNRITNGKNWVEFSYTHPDKKKIGVFVFLGHENLDGTDPLDFEKVMNSLGWKRDVD